MVNKKKLLWNFKEQSKICIYISKANTSYNSYLNFSVNCDLIFNNFSIYQWQSLWNHFRSLCQHHVNILFLIVFEACYSKKKLFAIYLYLIAVKMKEKVSKLTYPTLQHCLRMLHIMHTTIMKCGIGQSGSKP